MYVVPQMISIRNRIRMVTWLQKIIDTAPPKTIMRVTQSLVEIGAVPGINFYFGGTYVEENPTGPFLRSDFLHQAVCPRVAFRVANHFRCGT